jgi:hypothetical protein
MQTHKVLETIEWLGKKFEPVTEVLFAQLPHVLRGAKLASETGSTHAPLLIALHALGAIIEEVNNNLDAIRVLDAFKLESLHDKLFIIHTFDAALQATEGEPPTDVLRAYYAKISSPWHSMVSCALPLTSLTIPEDLQENSAGLLSIEVSDRPDLDVTVLHDVLKATIALYDAVGKAYSHEATALRVIKIESGSGFTVSVKGVADTVKEVKNLIVELWNKHRHKRADEIINHNRAVASSVEVLEHIETRIKNKSLQPEDGERFKRAIVNNTLTLFKNGALLTDIPHIEVVNNRQLLDGFNSQRLLSASEPEVIEGDTAASPRISSLKTKRPPSRKKPN